jgi:biotin carboxylase
MKQRIIILGAGVMQGPALRCARKLGLSSIAVDGNPDAPCRTDADRFEQIDLKDYEKILKLAEKLKTEDEGLSGIMTAGTDFSASVAYAAERLELPGINLNTALDASDKERMRRRFAAAGVPSPAFFICSAPQSKPLPFDFPVVVKPVDNMGGRGCRNVTDTHKLHEAVVDALNHSRSSRVIIEEYMDGPEFSVDALIYQGTITMCGLAERHIFFPPYFIEMGHTMSARLAPEDKQAILDVFIAGIRALGIENGAAKGDIKLTAKGAMIGEIAARLSGGYMSGWTYPYASGVEPVRGALLIATGKPPGDMRPTRSWTSAERAFISIPGAIRTIHGLEAARRLANVNDIFLRARTGDRVKFPVNNVSKCGNVISAAPLYETACAAAEQAVKMILIELDAPDAETAAFLASPLDTEFPPSAYKIDAALRRVLDALPDDKLSGCVHSNLTICPFPAFTTSSLTDYVGRTVLESLAAVRTLTALPLREAAQGTLGRQFWSSLIRGGYQGAAYHVQASGRYASLI